MSQVNPPYRADIVGSFLRPAAVKEARAQFAAGTLSREALTAVENDAIRDLVAKEKAAGLVARPPGAIPRAPTANSGATCGILISSRNSRGFVI